MLGHIALAVLPGLTGVGAGLLLVALGSGALKANASSLLGTLYEKGDAPADGGFTLFYLGINLGAFVGPLLTGLLQTSVGFHWGFGAAAVGMAVGLGQYVVFRRNLGTHGRDVPNPLPHNKIGIYIGALIAVVAVVAVAVAIGLVTLENLSHVTTVVIAAAAIAYFVLMLRSPKVEPSSAPGCERSFRSSSRTPSSGRCSSRSSPCSRCTPTSGWTGRSSAGRRRPVGSVPSNRCGSSCCRPSSRGVDPARQPRTLHPAQVLLRCHRHGCGVPSVPADGGHDRQGGARSAGDRDPGRLRRIRADDLADRSLGSPPSLRPRRFGPR